MCQDEVPQPTYAATFRCIGPNCEDTCCGSWDIPVDKVTYLRYREFPQEKLGSLVSRFVSRSPEGAHDSVYAQIGLANSGFCPFFGPDMLCGIQKEYGPSLLSSTCSLYPRSLSQVNGRLEGSLSLSCPEAARVVLLQPELLQIQGDLLLGEFRTDNVFSPGGATGSYLKPQVHFLSIRAMVMALVRDRSRAMWERLLIIASLCVRLDELIVSGSVDAVPDLLDRYRQALGRGPSTELEKLSGDLKTRLEVVIALSDQRNRDPSCGQRFRLAFWDFVEGIGSADTSTQDQDIDRFRSAEEMYFRPFTEKFPYILENYLLNYMFQHLFPFGRAGSERFAVRSLFDECILMSTQFAWVSSLLIGIAGHYKDGFSQEHVISTVQSFTRAVEHVPQVLEDIVDAVKRRGLANLQGMAVLLRA